MENLDFKIASEWVDFFNNDLSSASIIIKNNIKIRPIKEDEYTIGEKITKLCLGQSREFYGETYDFIKKWKETKNSNVFVAEVEEEIVGICLVNVYGFDSEKGASLWLRELAVNPKYQSKGIGRSLVKHCIKWGLKKGAKRSFLACDAENHRAISIYEKSCYTQI